ncbi:MAG: hypothetical protein AB7V42_00555 [Thermoleophilia bacterium]
MNGPNRDLLRIEFLGVTVRHDEVEMPREDLALFFAGVSDRYGMSRFEYHSDSGATFSGADGAECVLRPSQIASCGVTGLGYLEGIERVLALVDEAVERYGIGQMWIEDITLVAIWDVEDPELARELLVGSVLQIDEDRLELLGGDHVSVGLRIWRRAGEAAIECAVEPMHSEPSKVYIRLVQTQGEAVPDVAALREAADGIHEFLQGPLASFILARAHR